MAFSVSYIYDLVDRYSSKIKKITASTKKFQKTIIKARVSLKKFGDTTKRVGKKMGALGKSLFTKLTLPIALFGAVTLKASMDFNKGMANIASLIPNSINRVKQLKNEVRKMSKETGIGVDIMSEGLYQVISAFGDTADTTKILGINAKAATAGLATVTDAVNLTSAVMKGYGDVSEAGARKAADLAFQTVKLGQTSFPQLAASIGKVTPLAAQLGIEQEELFAGFATLTGVTGNAAEVSTQMAGAMRALLKPTPAMTKAIQKLGYASGKAMLGDKGMIGSFKALNKLTGGNEQKMTEMFGRMEPLVAIFSLLGKQSGDYTTKLKAMMNATGSMNEAYKEQTEGINAAGHKWKQFKQIVADFGRMVGDTLMPAFGSIVGFLSPIVDWMTKWIKNNQRAAKVIMIVVAAIAILIPILTTFAFILASLPFIITGVSVALGILGSVAGVVFSPIILTVLAVVAVVGGLILLFMNFGKVTGWLGGIIKSVWNGISNWVTEAYTALISGITEFIDTCIGKVQELMTFLANSTIGKWLNKLTGSVGTVMSTETYNKDSGGSAGTKDQSVNLNGQINVGVNGGKVESSSLQTDTGGNLGFNNPSYSH